MKKESATDPLRPQCHLRTLLRALPGGALPLPATGNPLPVRRQEKRYLSNTTPEISVLFPISVGVSFDQGLHQVLCSSHLARSPARTPGRWPASAHPRNPLGSPDEEEITMTGTPPVRRRLLGSALREYRERLGYNLDEAARILECEHYHALVSRERL
jgi:hypothetical protein